MKRKLLLRPINVDGGGCCKCIKATYCHMAWTNFTRELIGMRDGFSVTGVVEIYEDSDRP